MPRAIPACSIFSAIRYRRAVFNHDSNSDQKPAVNFTRSDPTINRTRNHFRAVEFQSKWRERKIIHMKANERLSLFVLTKPRNDENKINTVVSCDPKESLPNFNAKEGKGK